MSYIDLKKTFFNNEGFTGTPKDMEMLYHQYYGGLYKGSITDSEMKALEKFGHTQASLNDRRKAHLANKGYTQASILDREIAALNAGEYSYLPGAPEMWLSPGMLNFGINEGNDADGSKGNSITLKDMPCKDFDGTNDYGDVTFNTPFGIEDYPFMWNSYEAVSAGLRYHADFRNDPGSGDTGFGMWVNGNFLNVFVVEDGTTVVYYNWAITKAVATRYRLTFDLDATDKATLEKSTDFTNFSTVTINNKVTDTGTSTNLLITHGVFGARFSTYANKFVGQQGDWFAGGKHFPFQEKSGPSKSTCNTEEITWQRPTTAAFYDGVIDLSSNHFRYGGNKVGNTWNLAATDPSTGALTGKDVNDVDISLQNGVPGVFTIDQSAHTNGSADLLGTDTADGIEEFIDDSTDYVLNDLLFPTTPSAGTQTNAKTFTNMP